ncbi:acyl-CoA dehydrogenase family protein [Haliangium sp.]|uniref:acyl-CoA dehydrogenase family protein n=1 Tax=Haliangium sp. TaxID=2663208 RepID=UPI003D0EE6D4
MSSAYIRQEHQQLREEVRELFASEVLPHADEWERERQVPRRIWAEMGARGLLGLHYPEAVGGAGKDLFHSVVLLEELGRTGYTGFRVAIAVHAYMATSYLAHAGGPALVQRYLAPAIAGTKIAALALTEPDAGSDLSRLQTVAVRDGDSYVIDGRKKFVANGTVADFVIVAVRTGAAAPKGGAGGLSMIVVDSDSPGLDRTRLDNLGWHSSDTVELTLDGVRVPAENLIGSENRGFLYLMRCLQLERLAAGILALGGIDRCLELTWQYISQRKIYGGTISKLQAVRHRMAELVTEATAVRQLAYHAAWLYDHGDPPVAECSMVKLKATELAVRVAQECMQFHGADGYQSASAVSRMYRDAQAATIAGGASEVLRDLLAQATFEDAAWRRRRFSS